MNVMDAARRAAARPTRKELLAEVARLRAFMKWLDDDAPEDLRECVYFEYGRHIHADQQKQENLSK